MQQNLAVQGFGRSDEGREAPGQANKAGGAQEEAASGVVPRTPRPPPARRHNPAVHGAQHGSPEALEAVLGQASATGDLQGQGSENEVSKAARGRGAGGARPNMAQAGMPAPARATPSQPLTNQGGMVKSEAGEQL